MSAITRVAVTAVAALALAIPGALPASADTINGGCNSGRGDNLNAFAQFTVSGDGWRTWYRFGGRPYGTGNGDSNNVNFYFRQDYVVHWADYSPDNVDNGTWYTVGAGINMPPWSVQEVQWEAIFDHRWEDDPNCSAFGSP